MAYVQSKVMKKRLQEKRRVSGAALLREELNNDGNSSTLLDGLPAFQQNKGVMMANFEEWIKMATDNKINSTNSWNFALIDYFHDMNVLRESDNNINFQKASATLDGCVKIYSSRVDSAATETGRLLSGLATRKASVKSEELEGEDDQVKVDDEEEEDEDGDVDAEDEADGQVAGSNSKRKSNKKSKGKGSENTLTAFANIKIKKLSLELAIDPLFKKTLAEFDEGGARSLLLNTLSMDNHSRVVFDASSTNANDQEDESEDSEDVDNYEIDNEDIQMSGIHEEDLDISVFKNFIFSDESDLDKYTLCPSMDHLETVLKDINKAKAILSDVNQRNAEISDELPPQDFDFDFGDADDGGFYDGGGENSYGELDQGVAAVIFQDDLQPGQVESGNDTGVVASVVDQNLMSYFDNTMKRNWAGPEHWKVAHLKKDKIAAEAQSGTASTGQKAKKVKEPFLIDFLSPIDEKEEEKEEKKLFAKSKAATTLPQDQWETPDSNLLPNDLYFSSEQLTILFLKPSQKLNLFRKRVNVCSTNSAEPEENREVDASFWAENYEQQEKDQAAAIPQSSADDEYDMDFGGGDFDYGGDFDDDVATTQLDDKANFGTQLITGGARVKPEYVNYSKTAKNVNVKKLKDNLWKVLEKEHEKEKGSELETQFSSVMKGIGRLYPREQKKIYLQVSVSFAFYIWLMSTHLRSRVMMN